jgi:hypothetical protein
LLTFSGPYPFPLRGPGVATWLVRSAQGACRVSADGELADAIYGLTIVSYHAVAPAPAPALAAGAAAGTGNNEGPRASSLLVPRLLTITSRYPLYPLLFAVAQVTLAHLHAAELTRALAAFTAAHTGGDAGAAAAAAASAGGGYLPPGLAPSPAPGASAAALEDVWACPLPLEPIRCA